MSVSPFLTLPDGTALGHEAGYLPRLVGFTHEDLAAKGLRKLDGAAPQAAVHFTPAEMVSMHRALLLHAPRGGGKTALAEEVRRCLEGERAGDSVFGLARLRHPVARGPGAPVLAQDWRIGAPGVVVRQAGEAVPEDAAGPVLLILDALDRCAAPETALARAMAWLDGGGDRRLLVLCETGALGGIRRPADLVCHGLMPVLAADRAALLAPYGVADTDPAPAVWPGPWALNVAAGAPVDLRAAAVARGAPDLTSDARDALALWDLSPDEIAARLAADPRRWGGPVALLAERRWLASPAARMLATGLCRIGSTQALLIAAGMTDPGTADATDTAAALAAAIARGGAAPGHRQAAGEALARLGDPRDLAELVDVPAGFYPMGGDLHPNSAPAHTVDLRAYRIGRYPVTNATYGAFAEDTGREWRTATGRLPERTNRPATDLTWHDARAFCDWIAPRWRAEVRIAADEAVRLPTEPEWEAAARGPDGRLYPWGDDWAPERANDDESGFNDICAVGLFPEGAGPFGCLDMAGQAWEWCSTLWGADPAAPTFRFPWTDDGREAVAAGAEIRRVLRGGCFSSGRAKANGVYRGSLEPGGSWRGNGFRVVVARGAVGSDRA